MSHMVTLRSNNEPEKVHCTLDRNRLLLYACFWPRSSYSASLLSNNLAVAFVAHNVKTIASHFLCLLTVGGRRPLTASCRSEWKLAASLIQQLFPSLSSSTGLITIILLALKFTSPSSVSKVELELFGSGSLLGLVFGAVPGHRRYCITAIARFSLTPTVTFYSSVRRWHCWFLTPALHPFGLLKAISLARFVDQIRSNQISARALIPSFCRYNVILILALRWLFFFFFIFFWVSNQPVCPIPVPPTFLNLSRRNSNYWHRVSLCTKAFPRQPSFPARIKIDTAFSEPFPRSEKSSLPRSELSSPASQFYSGGLQQGTIRFSIRLGGRRGQEILEWEHRDLAAWLGFASCVTARAV